MWLALDCTVATKRREKCFPLYLEEVKREAEKDLVDQGYDMDIPYNSGKFYETLKNERGYDVYAVVRY